MRVRWTAPAAHDLYTIVRRIRLDNPEAARRVAKTIYDGCRNLEHFPHRGRKGRIEGTRELVFPGLPTRAFLCSGEVVRRLILDDIS